MAQPDGNHMLPFGIGKVEMPNQVGSYNDCQSQENPPNGPNFQLAHKALVVCNKIMYIT